MYTKPSSTKKNQNTEQYGKVGLWKEIERDETTGGWVIPLPYTINL